MAQTYKMMLGTSGKQWEILTVKDDGTMMLYFHGTNQSVTQQVTVITDGEWKGWLRSEKGSMFPGLASGRWQAVDDGRGKMEDIVETTENHAEAKECESPIINEPIPNQQQMNHQTEVTESPIADETIPSQQQMNPQTEVTESPIADETITNQPRPRRQRKPRKPAVERQTSDIDRQTSDIDLQPSAIIHQQSSTLKAIGMVAAATVALFVIYETGLLIPLGLIGLATGGILK